MPRRLTNLLLLVLLLGLAASGLLGWLLPEARALALYELHRWLGVALLGLLFWKQIIARRSLRRRLRIWPADRSILAGLATGLVLLASLGFGLAWTLQLVSFDALWGYSPLNLHVYLGLTVLGCLLVHLVRRWEGPGPAPVRTLLTRRSLPRLLGLAALSLVGWRLLEQAAEARADGARRPSGSKHAGSFSGNAFPVTSWLFDTTPPLDARTWRLELSGRLAAPGAISYAELTALPPREVRAVLDCTGGWWSEQVWRGVGVGDLLEARGLAAGAREARVSSVTGHQWTYPLDELRGALLCTHVGEEPLSPDHGYPVRLVAPGRRGFQWVKWVGRIEVG